MNSFKSRLIQLQQKASGLIEFKLAASAESLIAHQSAKAAKEVAAQRASRKLAAVPKVGANPITGNMEGVPYTPTGSPYSSVAGYGPNAITGNMEGVPYSPPTPPRVGANPVTGNTHGVPYTPTPLTPVQRQVQNVEARMDLMDQADSARRAAAPAASQIAPEAPIPTTVPAAKPAPVPSPARGPHLRSAVSKDGTRWDRQPNGGFKKTLPAAPAAAPATPAAAAAAAPVGPVPGNAGASADALAAVAAAQKATNASVNGATPMGVPVGGKKKFDWKKAATYGGIGAAGLGAGAALTAPNYESNYSAKRDLREINFSFLDRLKRRS